MAAKKKKVPEKKDAGTPRPKRSLRGGAEEAIGVDLAKYPVLFESVPLGIAISDKAGNIIDCNRMAEQLLGLPKKDQLSRQIDGREWCIIRPDGSVMPADEYASVRALKENCIVSNVEMGLVKGEGDITWIDVTAAPIPLEGYGVAIAYSDITERKRAEKKLSSLAAIVENSDDAIIGKSLEGIITSWNDGAKKIYGYSASEAIGRSISMLVPADKIDDLNVILQKVRSGGPIFHYETTRIRKDGRSIEVSLTLSPIKDQNGAIIGMSTIARDITERKRADAALKVSEYKYRTLVENIPEKIFVKDDLLAYVSCNDLYARDLGIAAEAIAGKTDFDFYPRDLAEKYRADDWAVMASGATSTIDERYVLNGVEFWVSTLKTPIRDNAGNISGILGIFHDITERKRAEEALRESEERYRLLFNTIDEGFCIIEVIFDENEKPIDYRFLEINPSFEKQTGLIDARGRRMRELAPKHEEYWFEIYGKIALTGQPARFVNHAEQLHRWYDVYAFRFGLPENRQVAILFNDITERKKIEETIRTIGEDLERKVVERTSDLSDVNLKLVTEIGIRLDAEKQLTKSVGEKEVLLREVHHRVKNNLQIIISLLNLQSQFMTDATTLAAFRESQNRIRAMALVHEKLYQSADISKIDLDNYIRFLGNSLFQFFGMSGKGITLTMDIRDISVAIDTAIPVGLIINELISNSLKYAFPAGRKGEISVAMHRQDHTLSILFKDNGVGLPEDFDWRNPKSLGLRLVVTLVTQLFGTIELDRTAGTAFTIVVKEKE